MRADLRRRRVVGSVLCLLVLGVQPATAQAAGPRTQQPGPASVQSLRDQVASVGAELAAAASSYEQGAEQLDRLRQLEAASAVDVEEQARRAGQAQRRLDALARSAYRQPGSPLVGALLRGDAQAVGDYHFLQARLGDVAAGQRESVEQLLDARSAAEQLEQQRRSAREQAQQLQSRLEDDLARLRSLTAARQAELAAASAALLQAQAVQVAQERSRAEAARLTAAQAVQAARLPGLPPGAAVSVGGVACAGAVREAVNGFLPSAALCALSAPGQRLAYGAAPAFEALSAAFAQAFGSPLCVSDSYRDYAGQVDVFQRKPALAATPGRSQHGWGLAVDLCGGVERFGTVQHQWMQANAGGFGFVHPAWARPGGSRPEPWHWEFRPGA